MKVVTLLLLWIVVVAHASFMVIEMFPWQRPLVFDRVNLGFDPPSNEATAAPIVHNAGLYNGFLTVGLMWSILSRKNAFGRRIFFLSYATIAGIFGFFTLTPTTLYLQTVPATLALAAILTNQWSGPAERTRSGR